MSYVLRSSGYKRIFLNPEEQKVYETRFMYEKVTIKSAIRFANSLTFVSALGVVFLFVVTLYEEKFGSVKLTIYTLGVFIPSLLPYLVLKDEFRKYVEMEKVELGLTRLVEKYPELVNEIAEELEKASWRFKNGRGLKELLKKWTQKPLP